MQTLTNGLTIIAQGNPSAQPLVFIHGFPFDQTLWDGVIGELKEHYYCISYDVRGLGSSEVGHGQYTMEGYVDDLEAVLLHLNLDQPVVCGFSMGGYIALRASERLQCFKALILANTTATSDNNEAKLKRASALKKIDKKGVASFLEGFLAVAFSKQYQQKHNDTLVHWKEKILSFDPIGIKGALLAMISRTDTTSSLNQAPPTLFIEASKDEIIPTGTMKKLAETVKNAHYVELQESGHMSMLEHPQAFIGSVQTFLRNM